MLVSGGGGGGGGGALGQEKERTGRASHCHRTLLQRRCSFFVYRVGVLVWAREFKTFFRTFGQGHFTLP